MRNFAEAVFLLLLGHMWQKILIVIAFLLGFVAGAAFSRYIGFPVSFINDGCPYGTRPHFDGERSGCVPNDYIGI